MKKIEFALLITFSLTILGSGHAQDYTFKVLANKGGNEMRNGGAWQPIKTGAALKAEDEIKVATNAYLGLVHASGKPLELKEPRTYKVADLANNIKTGSSVLTKYTDFVLSSNSAEAKKNRLSATGAVDRDISPDLKLILPESQHSAIYNNEALISWEGTRVPGPYVLILRNMFDDEIARMETPETSYKINLSDQKLAKENVVIVMVASKGDVSQESKTSLIKRLPQADHDNVKKNLDLVLAELSEPTALNKLILAGFYEENKLLIDAIAAYAEAIKLAPDVPEYKEAFDDFLIRNKISQ